MAVYQYRCTRHGVHDLSLRIGSAPPRCPCPCCGTEMPRVFSAPMLNTMPRALVTARDRTERTRDEPDVVSSIPGRRRRPSPGFPTVMGNPALQRLPRP